MLFLFYKWRSRLWKVKQIFQSSIASSNTSNPDMNAVSLLYSYHCVSNNAYILNNCDSISTCSWKEILEIEICRGKVMMSTLLCKHTAVQLIDISHSVVLKSQHNAAIANTEPLFLQELQIWFLTVFGYNIFINWSIYNLDFVCPYLKTLFNIYFWFINIWLSQQRYNLCLNAAYLTHAFAL